jgi:predicted ribosomally synthesized peptide with SipW-like signal peptide
MENKESVVLENEQTTVGKADNCKKKTIRRAIASSIAFIVISVIIFSAQTVAYFSAEKTSNQNVIQSGNLQIEMIELKEEGGTQVMYTNPVSIMPATSVSKIVSVRNSGNLPVYVRISVKTFINKEENTLPDQWRSYITCSFNTEHWTYSDGYYYYNFTLEPGCVTLPLFDSVSFSPAMNNQFMNSEIKLEITTQATQANFGSSSALNSTSWPSDNVQND